MGSKLIRFFNFYFVNYREDYEFARHKKILDSYNVDVIFPKIQRENEEKGESIIETFYPVVEYTKRADDMGMIAFLGEQGLKSEDNPVIDRFNNLV